MTGLVELNQTYENIMSRLKSEAFFHSGSTTPYSRDPELDILTEQVGTRLMTYPGTDFACYTDLERKR